MALRKWEKDLAPMWRRAWTIMDRMRESTLIPSSEVSKVLLRDSR